MGWLAIFLFSPLFALLVPRSHDVSIEVAIPVHYVAAVTYNGEPLERPWITGQQLREATLRLELSSFGHNDPGMLLGASSACSGPRKSCTLQR